MEPAAGSRHRRRLSVNATGETAGPELNDLPGHSDARPRRPAARDQPARSPRRAARSGRDLDRHRPGPGSAARPDRPGAVLPVLDDHGQDRRGSGAARRSVPFLRRRQHRRDRAPGPHGKWVPVRLGEAVTTEASPAAEPAAAASGTKATVPTEAGPAAHEATIGFGRRQRPFGSVAAPAVATPSHRSLCPLAGYDRPVLPRLHARIRVDATQLDDLVGLAGELVVVSDNLMGLRELPGVETWIHALEALQRVSRQIRDTTLDLRMVPVDELFSRFPRVVRDLADRSGKEIELRIVGQETRLDRTIVERLSDPMIHLIRNAVDHALEHPSERLEKGKPRVGRITLWAGHEGDRVAIRVEDDGRGLDREKIVQEGNRAGHGPHRDARR